MCSKSFAYQLEPAQQTVACMCQDCSDQSCRALRRSCIAGLQHQKTTISSRCQRELCIFGYSVRTEPFKTYSSPSRLMLSSMLRASDDATLRSVIRKADRILPSSSGSSHVFFCSALPYLAMTSMLPVSGAAQFTAYSTISINRGKQKSWAYFGCEARSSKNRSDNTILQVGQIKALGVSMLAQEHVPETELLGFLLQVINNWS